MRGEVRRDGSGQGFTEETREEGVDRQTENERLRSLPGTYPVDWNFRKSEPTRLQKGSRLPTTSSIVTELDLHQKSTSVWTRGWAYPHGRDRGPSSPDRY